MLRPTKVLLSIVGFTGCLGGSGALSPVDFEEEGGLEARKLFEGRGAASVALEVGEEIFVGFFIGDQIERVRKSDMKSAN